MLEITFEHKDIFELFKENNHVYKDGVYDFTFEGRFAVYHCHYKNELVYISLDMEKPLRNPIQKSFVSLDNWESSRIALFMISNDAFSSPFLTINFSKSFIYKTS